MFSTPFSSGGRTPVGLFFSPSPLCLQVPSPKGFLAYGLGHIDATCPLSRHLKHWIELDTLVLKLERGLELYTFKEVEEASSHLHQ